MKILIEKITSDIKKIKTVRSFNSQSIILNTLESPKYIKITLSKYYVEEPGLGMLVVNSC